MRNHVLLWLMMAQVRSAAVDIFRNLKDQLGRTGPRGQHIYILGGVEVANRDFHVVFNKDSGRKEVRQFNYVMGLWMQAKPDSRRHQVCTGVLVSPRFVLTAAHCFGKPGLVFVFPEATQVTHDNQMKVQGRPIVHEGYEMKAGGRSVTTALNDIALVQLDQPLRLNEQTNTVRLPRKRTFIQEMTGMGYGVAKQFIFGELIMDWKLRIVQVGMRECPAESGMNNVVCAGNSTAGTDRGDSGGPLVRYVANQPYNYGVVSIGSSSYANGSADGFTYYTSVPEYCDWIESKTEGEVKCVDVPE